MSTYSDFFFFYFVQIYTLNLNLLAAAPPRKEQKNGTFRPCSSLFLYLLQSGFSRQLSYKCDVTAKKLRVHFIYRLPVLVMAHRSMPLDEWFKMRTWLVSFPSLNGVRGGGIESLLCYRVKPEASCFRRAKRSTVPRPKTRWNTGSWSCWGKFRLGTSLFIFFFVLFTWVEGLRR